MTKKQKTIFITASRGFIVRNILRSGVLDELKRRGLRIVVFLNGAGTEIPQSLRDEFEDEQVVLVNALLSPRKPGHVRFAKIAALLVFSKSTWHHSQIGNTTNLSRAFFWKYLELIFSLCVSRFHFFKTFARFLERTVFVYDDFAEYFDIYRPAAVFSTSIVSGSLDIEMMKEARKRGIKTASMPKGWDNITKALYRFVPDMLIVQNEHMKRGAIAAQGIQAGKIVVAGFPQFDWYRRKDILLSREEYCATIGADPKRKLIFFGSEGRWAPQDDSVAALLVQWVEKNAFVAPATLFIRPHFSDAATLRFDTFKGRKPHVIVDENFTHSAFFSDNWDPGVEETIMFTNLMHHSDVVINAASTLTLDAACCDKPVINIAFGVLHHKKTGKDISPLLYTQDHYDWVLETNAVDLVYSEKELHESINNYLLHPDNRCSERKQLRDTVCCAADGNSSKRVAHAMLQLLA